MTRISMKAKFNGKCNYCLKPVIRGTDMFYDPDHKAVWHPACKLNPWVEIVGRGRVDWGRPRKRGPIRVGITN